MVITPVIDKGSLEWIQESRLTTGEYGTFPTNPTLKSIGLVKDFMVHTDRKLKSKRYLRAHSDVTKLPPLRTLQTGGTIEGSFTYYPQNWDLLPFIIGPLSAFASSIDSLSFLRYLDGEYTIISGVMLTDYTININKSDYVTIDVTFKAGDITDPGILDPIGTGTHAVEDSSDPFLWQDITNIRFGSANPPIETFLNILGDIKLSIKNEVKIPEINSSVMFSYAGFPVLNKRDVDLSLDLTWESVESFWEILKNSEQQYFSFVLGGRHFLIEHLIVPELNLKQDPDEYIGEMINFRAYIPNMSYWITGVYRSLSAWPQKPPLGAQINWAHPITKGLVGCWLFNEGGGDKAYDMSGYNNHGTLTNMAFPSTTTSGWNPGKDGVGLAFDGTDDYVDCGNDPSLNITNAITMEGWVKSPEATTKLMSILAKNGWGTAYYLGSDGVNKWGTQIKTTGGLDTLWISGAFVNDRWYHLAATYDGTVMKVYINGCLRGTKSHAHPGNIVINSYHVLIGKEMDFSGEYSGPIDKVSIYNRALTASEILELYSNPYCIFKPAMIYIP